MTGPGTLDPSPLSEPQFPHLHGQGVEVDLWVPSDLGLNPGRLPQAVRPGASRRPRRPWGPGAAWEAGGEGGPAASAGGPSDSR